jgi:hypothetical protein
MTNSLFRNHSSTLNEGLGFLRIIRGPSIPWRRRWRPIDGCRKRGRRMLRIPGARRRELHDQVRAAVNYRSL